ncbi:hypothetical protein AV530_007703 [Patagioenas fasciata monilis]|uniref:Uncharacterized protein n=1 Tax=Patagioenas fasciata monilis TaxID=372326 RepID=A0A1V4K0F1_PATFA|nr:hypothetical protein AV530_007703 [Patagioenas fasciata monilis]
MGCCCSALWRSHSSFQFWKQGLGTALSLTSSHVTVLACTERYLMYYFSSKFNKAKMSSFSFRARAVRAVRWKHWSSVASRREPIDSCDEQSRHGETGGS